MAAQSALRSTLDILQAVQAAIVAVQWHSAAAFQAVKRFDVDDLQRALRELIINREVVAFVIYGGERFDSRVDGRDLLITRVHELTVLFSTRVLGNRQTALEGSSSAPGLYELKDLLLVALTGELESAPNPVSVRPTNVTAMLVEDNTPQKLPGRACLALELEAVGGWLQAAHGTAPIY